MYLHAFGYNLRILYCVPNYFSNKLFFFLLNFIWFMISLRYTRPSDIDMSICMSAMSHWNSVKILCVRLDIDETLPIPLGVQVTSSV